MNAVVMRDVTDADRHAAFEAMQWAGWSYEDAMADDTRRRVVEARAHQLRTRSCCAREVSPPSMPPARAACAPRPVQTPALSRPPLAGAIDRKRAAAGDRDD